MGSGGLPDRHVPPGRGSGSLCAHPLDRDLFELRGHGPASIVPRKVWLQTSSLRPAW
jgi:hypothetical protein